MSELTWDLRFLTLAKTIALFSKDPSTKVGAVIVRPDKSIVSTGYNGFPRQMEDRAEWYENRTEKYSRIIHAEVNALIQAKQSIDGCTLYTYPSLCCDRCCVQMIQAGITRFVSVVPLDDIWSRWKDSLIRTRQFIHESEILDSAEYDLEDLE
jgi:dCMP deaminase